MSYGRLTVDLWRRAAVWRMLIIGAVVLSILAIVMGSGSSPGNNTVTTPVPPTTTGSTTGNANVAGNQPSLCSPASPPARQMPIASNATGQAPLNTSISTSGGGGTSGMNVSTQARIQQFIFEVDAALSDGREGESCVRMAGALDSLQAVDNAYASCFTDGAEKFARANACRKDASASEVRFSRLITVHETVKQDNSAANVEQLAIAMTSMSSFDRSTERWGQLGSVTADAQKAVDEVKASDDRIKRLEAAARATTNSEDATALTTLAIAGQLTALDRARLSTMQQEMLDQAEAARKKLNESDKRFQSLETALNGNSSTDIDSRAALIDAVSRLEPFDIARANATQAESIGNANAAASTYAMEDLLEYSSTFSPDSEQPKAFERLRDLRTLVLKYGGVEQPGPEVASALEIAKKAEAALMQSDTRIRNMRELVTLVREGGPAVFGDSVIDGYNAIRPFDIARFTDEEKRIYEELDKAREISDASKKQKLTRSVPIFLRAAREHELLQQAEEELKSGLRSTGFNLVTAEEQSAVSLVISLGAVVNDKLNFSGSTINTSSLSLKLRGKWTITDQSVDFPEASGKAIKGEADVLNRKAISSAVKELLQEVNDRADEQ